MNEPDEIVEITVDKPRICGEILRTLPDWFGIEASIAHYAAESADLPMFGCRVEGEVVGILTLRVHTAHAAEIAVIGVRPARHRRGIGRQLVSHALSYARDRGLSYLTVKTLSPKREDVHYARTRAFYEAMGFVPLETFDTLWSPENPALMMIRPV